MTALFTRMSGTRFALSAVVVAGLSAFAATPTEAATLGFSCVTNNSASSCAIGESQLSAALTDLGNGSVEFVFQNTGVGASSITQLYFDQPGAPMLSLLSFSASNGVAFQNSGPAAFAAGGQGGINPGQWLKLTFTLNQGSTFASLLTSLATGNLRIGAHVQGIGAYGNSESFIGTQVVPEPASLILLGTGLLGAAAARRRRRQASALPPQ